LLDPPRAGSDPYAGDISLLCSTPGKSDHDQNCTGADARVWSAMPIDNHAVLAAAIGDPFADPAACAESNGAAYKSDYLDLAAGKNYCLRKAGDTTRTVALRVAALPTQQPLPTSIALQAAVLAG
jgi:hypothetical protein